MCYSVIFCMVLIFIYHARCNGIKTRGIFKCGAEKTVPPQAETLCIFFDN